MRGATINNGFRSVKRRYHEAEPFHIDYCFLPRAWKPALREVSIGTFSAFEGRSDHRPLTVNFTI